LIGYLLAAALVVGAYVIARSSRGENDDDEAVSWNERMIRTALLGAVLVLAFVLRECAFATAA
jgi:hypothetical protein